MKSVFHIPLILLVLSQPAMGENKYKKESLISLDPCSRQTSKNVLKANNDSFKITTGFILTGNILQNDQCISKLRLVDLSSKAEHGRVEIFPDGRFTYKPDEGFVGEDSFKYKISGENNISSEATVTIKINPSESSAKTNIPQPVDQEFNVASCSEFQNVVSRDLLQPNEQYPKDILKTLRRSDVSHGQLDFKLDGSFRYIPNPGYIGMDEFSYVISDGKNTSRESRIKLTVEQEKSIEPDATPDQDPIILYSGRWMAKQDSQPSAFEFKPQGKLIIHYRYSSGTFTREGEYKIKGGSSACPRSIDLIMTDGRILKTIFEIQGNGRNKVLRMELTGLVFGQNRPTLITPKGAKEFGNSSY